MTKRNWKILLACLTVFGLFLAGCTGASDPTPTPESPTTAPPTDVPPTEAPPTEPPATEPPMAAPPTELPPTEPAVTTAAACTVTAESEITIYQRPSLQAGIFGVLAAGNSVAPTMRSDDGWLGFDPAVAQAANVGVFRLRWIAPDADATQSGDCAALPLAPPISPTACYFMAFDNTDVYAEPDPASAVQATIPAEGYAAVIGKADNGWYQLDLQDSTLHQPGPGWLDPNVGNFNGTCEVVFGAN